MSVAVKVGGAWKNLSKPYVKVGGVWKPAAQTWVKVAGAWKYADDGSIREQAFTTNTGTAANNAINAVALQSDGKILVGGNFTTWNGATVNRIVRLNSDGTQDTAFTTNTGSGAGSSVNSIAVQSDGKILVGGNFTTWNGATVGRIVRLNSDGTRDTAFSTNVGLGARSGTCSCLALQSDGKILVGGNFREWGADFVSTDGLARLNSTGTLDTAFATNAGAGSGQGYIYSLAVQSDGKILVGGSFMGWNNNVVYGLVRLNSTGTEDTAFTTNIGTGADNHVRSIFIQSTGKIVVGGFFTNFNGSYGGGLIRLNTDGTRDTAFQSNVGSGTGKNTLYVVTPQSNGKIIATGSLLDWNGSERVDPIVRLSADAVLDTTFVTGSATRTTTYLIGTCVVQSDGKIIVAGLFDKWNGATVNNIARLVIAA